MKVARVTVTPIAFRDPPLLNASGIHEPYALRSILEVESDNGFVGLGETYGDAPVLALLQRLAPELVGLDVHDLNGLRARVSATALDLARSHTGGAELAPGSQGARLSSNGCSAFEVALLDLQARARGIRLVDLLGGAVRTRVPFSGYLFFKYGRHVEAPYDPDPWGEALEPDQIVAQARRMIGLYGFRSLKLKAGALDPEHEVTCLKALRGAFPDLPLRIDPNASWTLETAVRMAERLKGDLEYYEDPTAGLEGMAELHRRTGLPLATNMVVTGFDGLRRAIELRSVQIVLADHHYWGGLHETRVLARMCQVFGLGLSMHSNSHLGISLLAMSHVAASIPNLSYACDTHYPWQEDEDEVIAGGKVPIRDGAVSIPDAPGLGVDLDRDRLRRLHEQFLACGIRCRDDVGQMRKYDPAWTGVSPRF